MSRWREALRKKKDRLRKRREKERKKRRIRPHGVGGRGNGKGALGSGMIEVPTQHHAKGKDAMSREYIIRHEPGVPLTYDQRIRLGAEWNRLIKAGCRVTLRGFALPHGLTEETWRREYLRGAKGVAIRARGV